MKKYLISLEKDSHRRALFFAQANTQEFNVFNAINTMDENEATLNKQFNFERFQSHYGRAITKGEIGCTLSHLAVYQMIRQDNTITQNEYCLICEDDALFNNNFQQNLEDIITHNDLGDMLLVGQSKISQFNDRELEINYPTTFRFLQKKWTKDNLVVSYPYKNYFAGTVAYLIKKSAAARILSEVEKEAQPYWLADDFILFGNQFNFDIKVVRPLMAIENPKINSNLEAVRGSIDHHLVKKLMKYPAKKILAIIRNLGK